MPSDVASKIWLRRFCWSITAWWCRAVSIAIAAWAARLESSWASLAENW
jgi:hypothetical protein